MKPIPDCVPDALQLVLDAARQVSDDPFIHRKVLTKVMSDLVEDPNFDSSSVELTFRCLRAAYKALGVKDPYETEKARRNKAVLGLEASFRKYLDVAPDRTAAAISLLLAGYIDTDILGRADAERTILEGLDTPVAHDDRQGLIQALRRAERVLYIVDKAGEIVLDKLFIEDLARTHQVTAVVAAKPMLTAATADDAQAVNLGAVSTVIDPGAPMLGLVLEKASSAFREVFQATDVVIVKGELNYETLANIEREAFFLLQARCASVAARLDVAPGSSVLLRHSGKPATGVCEAAGAGAGRSERKKG